MLLTPNWLTDLLGQSTDDVLQLIPEAFQVAHQRARNVQDVSGLTQLNPYGNTSWLVVFEEFVTALGQIPGATVMKPKGASYWLVILNGTVICPCRVRSNRITLADAPVKATQLRRTLSALHRRTTAESTLDLALIDYNEADLFTAADLIPTGTATRALFVPFDVDAVSGITAVGLGTGQLLRTGPIDWTGYVDLDLDLHAARPTAMNKTEEPRFDSGELPEPLLIARPAPVENPAKIDEEQRDALDIAEDGTDD